MNRAAITFASALILAASIAGCAQGRAIVDAPRDTPTVALLDSSSSALEWNGIRLGMTRAELERALGSPVAVRPDDSPAPCGAYHSVQRIAGRETFVQWSSDGDDGRVELIHVPLTGAERTMSAEQLAALAADRIPGLVGAGEEPLFAPSSKSAHLVLRDDPGMSLLLKPGAPDEAVYVSYRACLD